MSFQPVGDTAVLCKIAYELYKKGRQVKDAPKDFQALLRELALFAHTLRQLHEDDSTVPGQARPFMDEVKQQCHDALQDFRPTILKYQRLALSQRGIWLSRIQFVTDRQLIKSCRERLHRCKQDLVVALAVDTRQATAAGSIRPRVQSSASINYPEVESPRPQRLGSASTDRSGALEARLLTAGNPEDVDPFFQGLRRVTTLDTLDESPIPIRPFQSRASSLFAPVKRPRTRSVDTLDQIDPLHNMHSTPPHRSGRLSTDVDSSQDFQRTPDVPPRSTARLRSSPRLTIPSQEHPSDGTPSPFGGTDDSSRTYSPVVNLPRPENWYLDDVVAEQDNGRLVSPSTSQIANIAARLTIENEFADIQDRLQSRVQFLGRQNLSAALDRAVWWILKSRKCHTSLTNPHPDKHRPRQSWDIDISVEQALVDLLKSRAIVQFAIQQQDNTRLSFTEPQWKKLQDLAIAIKTEIKNQIGRTLERNPLNLLDKDFALDEEKIQPVEEESALPAGLDDLSSPTRWITVDKEDGGQDRQEKVLFRTFVNAQIGENRIRRKSSTAPYMLILWSQSGHAEIKVSLINQARTINLCRNILAEDLERHDDLKRTNELDFNFPDQDAVLRFNLADELEEFLQIPRRFFAAMKDRDPQPGEVLIFRDSLEQFEEGTVAAIRQATNGSSTRPSGKIHTSSEISLFEGIANECWKTTRRLVISSSPDTPSPWCISFWLPLCVQINIQDREVDLVWSDLSHLQKIDTGDFNPRWSYVLADAPNRVMHLTFEAREVAQEAMSYLLHPFKTFNNSFFRPLGSFTAGTVDGQDIQIWQLKDMDDRDTYFAILTVKRQPYATYVNSAYFLYRDFDFVFEHTSSVVEQASISPTLRFPFIRVPHYVSTVSNLPYDPTKEKDPPTPEFQDAVKIFQEVSFAFNDGKELRSFMKTLIGWDLIYYAAADQLTLGSRVSSKTQANAAVCLWSKSNPRSSDRDIRLTARAQDDQATLRWTTAKLTSPEDCMPNARWSKLNLKGIDILQGDIIDGSKLDAVDSKTGEPRTRDKVRMVISFADSTSARVFEGKFSSLLNIGSTNDPTQVMLQIGPGPEDRYSEADMHHVRSDN